MLTLLRGLVLALVAAGTCILGATGSNSSHAGVPELSDKQFAMLARLSGSWSGSWSMPSWTCMRSSMPHVVHQGGQHSQAIGLCCADDLANPMRFTMTLSFFDWKGRPTVERLQRSPVRQVLNNGMLVWGSYVDKTATHYVTRGQAEDIGCQQLDGDCESSCKRAHEVHAVRCCSDVPLEGWNNTYCPHVWQDQNEWKQCMELGYHDAVAFCHNKGARLCTRNELSSDCAKQPGCYFNQRLVWTQDSCGLSSNCNLDELPDLSEKHPSCAAQNAFTNKCEERRAGNLTDGLCESTCEVCGGACEDVPGFLDEWASTTWAGTCAAWAASGTPCDTAADDWGYTQAGEDAILANCRFSCGLCPDEGHTLYTILNVTERGKGLMIKSVNYHSQFFNMYVEKDRPAVGDLWVVVRSRSEIHSRYWHESYDDWHEEQDSVPGVDVDLAETEEPSGCTPGTVWPSDWYDTYVGLVNGSLVNSASSAIVSSWRIAIGRLSFHDGAAGSGGSDSPQGAMVAGSAGEEGKEEEDSRNGIIFAACIAGVSLGCLCAVLVWTCRCLRRHKVLALVSKTVKGLNMEAGLHDPGTSMSDVADTSKVDESASATDPEVSDLKHAKLEDIMGLGIAEHWMIPPSDLTLEPLCVGQGAFGEVRRGRLIGATEVAVKLARAGLGSKQSAQSRQSLANELRLLRRVRHRNIVLFHGATVRKHKDDFILCLVLEWVQGQDFRGMLKLRREDGSLLQDLLNSQKLTGDQAQLIIEKKLMLDTALAMQYLHGQHPPILHRDLKPANILVDKSIVPHQAKIADFGLSANLAAEEMSGRVGTMSYMAPEVKRGKGYDTAADVYSFGCILSNVLHTACNVLLGHPTAALMSEPDDALPLKLLPREYEVTPGLQAMLRSAQASLQEDPSARTSFSAMLEVLSSPEVDADNHSSFDASTDLRSGSRSSPGVTGTVDSSAKPSAFDNAGTGNSSVHVAAGAGKLGGAANATKSMSL